MCKDQAVNSYIKVMFAGEDVVVVADLIIYEALLQYYFIIPY